MKIIISVLLITVISAFTACNDVASNNRLANSSNSSGAVGDSESNTNLEETENSAALPANAENSGGNNSAKAENDLPENLIESLYEQHDNENSPFFQDKNRALVDRFFTKSLADKIWKDSVDSGEEVGALEFDPLYDAQDTEISDFKVEKPVISGEKATIDVTFTNFGEPQVLKYMLTKENGAWKIEDIGYGENSTLNKIYDENAGQKK